MRLRIMGSGTSIGVPEMGCQCEVCQSLDPRDKRMRACSFLEVGDTHILIDCGPDFRTQMLEFGWFGQIDGVLVTHEHYDHVGGLDDLRPYSALGDIPIFVNKKTYDALSQRMPYCFVQNTYPGIPKIYLCEVQPYKSFDIKGVDILPIEVMHSSLPILGYRIGRLTYITDMLTWDDRNVELLKGTDTLVINALRSGRRHRSHQTIEDAIEVSRKIGARKTYLIHMSHQAGLHEKSFELLPSDVEFAYDGMEIEIPSE